MKSLVVVVTVGVLGLVVSGCGKLSPRAISAKTQVAPESDSDSALAAAPEVEEEKQEADDVTSSLAATALAPAASKDVATPEVVIRNIVSDKYIEVGGGSTAVNAGVNQWERVPNLNPDYQKWKLVAVKDKKGAVIGRNFVNFKSLKCLNPVASNQPSGMFQRDCNTGNNQIFELTMIGQFYRIKNKGSQRCLTVLGNKNGAQIRQENCDAGDLKQRWQIQ